MESAPKNYKYQRIQLSNKKSYSVYDILRGTLDLAWRRMFQDVISEVLSYLAVCTFPDLRKLNSYANDL